MMTVRQLIDKLATMNPDAPVVLYSEPNRAHAEVRCVKTVRLAGRQASGFYPQFRAESLQHRNTVEAVCLE